MFSWDTFKMKLADFFTLLRIVLSPVFIILYFLPVHTGFSPALSVYIMIPLLLFAEFTDYLDGYFARKNKEVTDFGKLFDPFADVILHLTAFFCYAMSGYVSFIIILLLVYREFGMLFIRMTAAKQGIAIAARKGGKAKTVLYVIAGFYSLLLESSIRLGFTILSDYPALNTIGVVLYIIAVAASYASFIDYLVHFVPSLIKKK